jgi:hypothetical protein
MIEKTLYLLLSGLEGIALFPLVIPQEQTQPCVSYMRLKTTPTNTQQGTNRKHDNGQFQVDVWTKDYLRAAELAEQIIDRLVEAYGATALLLENKDEPYDSQPGIYHRVLVFSLREIRAEGGS